jgi:protein-tyrosine phosphatase
MRILMVCLGNICRSPMAEGIFRHHAQINKLNVEVDSAGTANYHVGEAPDRRAIEFLKTKGIDISSLRARQFAQSDFDAFDIIYAMDESNYNNILRLSRNTEDCNKVKLILSENPDEITVSVPDPYYGGMEGFENVFNLLDTVTKSIICEKKHPVKD